MSRKRKPRDAAEVREWLKQLAKNLRDIQAKPDEISLDVNLANWFADAVDAALEELTKRPRALLQALGLERPPGRPRGTDMGGLQTAIDVFGRRHRKETWERISEDLGIDVRNLQRTFKAHMEGVAEHFWKHAVHSIPFGYDLKDGKLVVNEREAPIVRTIFERYAQLDSAEAPKLAFAALVGELKAEGITDKNGNPIDIEKVIINRVYIGAHKGMYEGGHEAIVDRALWRRTHRVHRRLTAISPQGGG